MLNKKIVSVLAVTLMLTMGVGVVFIGNDESEAVTSEMPVSSVVGDVETLFYTSVPPVLTMTQKVANGTYFNITNTYNGPWEFLIKGINGTATAIGSTSDGLLHTAQGISGTLSTNLSTLSIEWVAHNETEGVVEEEEYSSVFTVVDTGSSQNNPYLDTISLPVKIFQMTQDYYANVGITVNLTHETVNGLEYGVTSVTSGFGLTVDSNTTSLSGTISHAGTITVETYVTDGHDIEEETHTIYVTDYTHADVRMIGGETWTYTPSTNMTSVLSISGTATSWVSLTSGTVSGTAPTNTSVGQTYDLTITASTSDPNQNVTQTVTFTVDPQITLTAPATYTVQFGTDTSNVLGSNFEDGTRNIYSITGGTATGFTVNAATGVLGWNNPSAGTITFTAASPYTYTSGATNTATATVDVTVTGILTASVSSTLYLVTGKTVPNTPAEAVTLNHNDVGVGTYTWAVVGTNNSGVTVASDGTLGGTPGAVGSYTVTIRCTSVVGSTTQTADTTLNIVIVQVLAFTSLPSSGTVR